MSSCSQIKSENRDNAGSKSHETPATFSAQSDEGDVSVSVTSSNESLIAKSQISDGNNKEINKADDDENDNAGSVEVALVNVPEHQKKKTGGKKDEVLVLSSGFSGTKEETFERSPPRKKRTTGFSALKKKVKSRFVLKRSSSFESINSSGAAKKKELRMKSRNSSNSETHLLGSFAVTGEQSDRWVSLPSEPPLNSSAISSSPISAASAPENLAGDETFRLDASGSADSTNSEADEPHESPSVPPPQHNDASAIPNEENDQKSVPDVDETFSSWVKGPSDSTNSEAPRKSPAAFSLQENVAPPQSKISSGQKFTSDDTAHAAGEKMEPTDNKAVTSKTLESNKDGQDKKNEGVDEEVPSEEESQSAPTPPPKIKFNQMVQRVMLQNSQDEEDQTTSFIIRNRDDAKKAAVLERLSASVRFNSKSDGIGKTDENDETDGDDSEKDVGDDITNEDDSKTNGSIEGDVSTEDESPSTPTEALETPKVKFNNTVQRVIATTSPESDGGTAAKNMIITNRDDARKAAVLERLSTSFRFKSARTLGSTNDVDDLNGPKNARRRFTSLVEKHKALERACSVESQSPVTTGKKPIQSLRGALSLQKSASTALLSHRSTIDSFEDADYAGFTGLRKLCNAVMLDGRQDLQWDRVREYIKRLDPEEAQKAAEKREGEEKETALHLVCRQRPPPDVVQLLLQASRYPASWKLKSSGWTPLHLECRSGGNELVVRLLLKAHKEGASDLDKQGRTPLHLATAKSVKTPPTFATLKRLMTKNILNTRSLPVTENNRRSAFQSTKTKKAEGTDCYPLELEYLAEQAEHIASESSSELNYAKECLEMLLDSKIEKLDECTHREASLLISTLEGSPDWFQEQAGVHPYVQAILNWKIGQRFATAVMLLDFYVLIIVISAFRIAANKSLVERYDLEGARSVYNMKPFDDGYGGLHSFWFWTRSDQSPALGISAGPDDDDDTLELFGPILALYVGVFYLLMREIFQMISLARRGLFSSWLFDVWNYLDVSCFSLVWLTTYSMHRGVGNNEDVKLKVVLTTGILWMMMLSFLKLTRRDFAVFVSGVIHVTVTLRSFLVTLGIFLAAFAQMYYTSFMGTERCVNKLGSSSDVDYDFCTAYGPYLKVYMMLLGGGVDESDFTFDKVSLYLSIWFSFTVVIILLNVLIAIVTDSYQDVKSHGEAVFWNHRLSFIFEVDQIHDMCEDFFCRLFSVKGEEESMDSFRSNRTLGDTGNGKSIIYLSQMKAITRRLSRGLSSSALSAISTDSLTDYSTDDEILGTLWDICLIAFEDPTETSVWRQKCNLNEKWTGPKWVLGNMENPLIYPDKVAPSMMLRLLYIFFIPIWVVAGLMTAGLLWPQQVRKWCFCSHLTVEEKGHKLASNEDIKTMNDHSKEEMRDEIRRVEGAMEGKFETIKDEIDDMKESIDDVKKSLGSMKEILNTLLEIEKRRSQREEDEKEAVNSNESQDPRLCYRESKNYEKKSRVRFDE